MKLRLSDGRTLEGTALEIVEAMRSTAFRPPAETLRGYIDQVVDWAERFHGVRLAPEGTTDEEISASLLAVLIRAGLGHVLPPTLRAVR